ncbi:serine/threonine-protein kinase [Streptomyces armeniacus]|uniref:serine/threonine-protein kinase n=1 Tax=Streptomyces armeniacus TaxID=83291 RepID=UPI001AD844CB|nr:serine/threonine-protein kinase [Streptomyces armeniacus]
MEALEPGDPRRVGRYRITGRLGAGGMGRVFLGRSPSGRLVAVKVVRPELAEDPGFRRRFAREVAAARKVTGFFTAAVVDADPDGSPPWLATAYVPGMPLDEAVAAYGHWPADSVRVLGAGLAEALEAVHEAGLVHRDLKPSNVLIAPDGPRVVDFGISVAIEATALTRTGVIVGTPGFMAPEQLTGKSVTPACDVFALGAVLTYAATGTGPFGTGSAQSLNFRIAYEEPDLSGLPPGLEIIADCLAKEPAERPAVSALVEELAPAAAADDYAPAATAPETAGWIPGPVARALPVNAEPTVTAAAQRPPVRAARPAPPEPPPPAPRSAARREPRPSSPVGPPASVPDQREATGGPERSGRTGPADRTDSRDRTDRTDGPVRSSARHRGGVSLLVALGTMALAMFLPAVDGESVNEGLADGSWPFLVAALLSAATSAGAWSGRRRDPDSTARLWARGLHGLIAALSTAVFVALAFVNYSEEGDFSSFGPGALLYAVGCAALILSTVRFPAPSTPEHPPTS